MDIGSEQSLIGQVLSMEGQSELWTQSLAILQNWMNEELFRVPMVYCSEEFFEFQSLPNSVWMNGELFRVPIACQSEGIG